MIKLSASTIKTIGLIFSVGASILTTTWALSKDTVIKELHQKNLADSMRLVTKSDNETRNLVIETKNIVVSIRDSLKLTNRNVKAVTLIMRDHILQTTDMSKNIQQIQFMYQTLGPFLNCNYKDSNEKKKPIRYLSLNYENL